jgi:hypothetical protein
MRYQSRKMGGKFKELAVFLVPHTGIFVDLHDGAVGGTDKGDSITSTIDPFTEQYD